LCGGSMKGLRVIVVFVIVVTDVNAVTAVLSLC
jgi:hypothetical protein